MAGPFGNFLNKNAGADDTAVKLQKEIEGMEFKKQSLISAVQGEIQAAKKKIDGEIYQIGLHVYENHNNGVEISDKLTAAFDEIKALNQLIAEKETKINDIKSRYDDEIGMLKSNLELMVPQQTAAAPARGGIAPTRGGVACPNCKHPYTPGVDMFCMGCGQKLDASAPPVSTGAACKNCGKSYTPGEDMFCMGCGQKL